MRVWDAELLTAKKELSPVTDGLLCWLDGQDELYHYVNPPHPTTDYKDYMFERTNGYKVNFYGTADANTENGFLKVNGSGSNIYRLSQSMFSVSFDNIRTVELISSSKAYGFYSNGFEPSNTNFLFGAANNKASIPISLFQNNMQLVGVINDENRANIYYNGMFYSSGSGNTGTLSGKPSLTFRWAGGLGCLRLYNRALSPEEIAQNLEYEVSIGRVVL